MGCGCNKNKNKTNSVPTIKMSSSLSDIIPSSENNVEPVIPTKRYQVVKSGEVIAEYNTLTEASDYARENFGRVRQTILNQ